LFSFLVHEESSVDLNQLCTRNASLAVLLVASDSLVDIECATIINVIVCATIIVACLAQLTDSDFIRSASPGQVRIGWALVTLNELETDSTLATVVARVTAAWNGGPITR
jgi:hypothetical protein